MATVKLQYFKRSGKYGYDGQFEADDNESPHRIFDRVEEMNKACALPGLRSGTWEGFVYVDLNDHPMAFPFIVTL